MNKFAERLKELREEKGFTQVKLAELTGFHPSAIVRWEKNLRMPSAEVIIRFAKFFNVSSDYLLGLQDYV